MTSKKGYLHFIHQMLAAYNAGKSFFVISNHKKTYQIAGIFKKLGIIKAIKITDFEENERSLFTKLANEKKTSHFIVWLQYTETFSQSTTDFPSVLSFSYKKKPEGHNIPFHKIVFTRKQSRINFSSKITTQKIFTFYKPKMNVISILETPRGLITSWEAITRKQAGYILCTIYI